jgi:hypothetical protein
MVIAFFIYSIGFNIIVTSLFTHPPYMFSILLCFFILIGCGDRILYLFYWEFFTKVPFNFKLIPTIPPFEKNSRTAPQYPLFRQNLAPAGVATDTGGT